MLLNVSCNFMSVLFSSQILRMKMKVYLSVILFLLYGRAKRLNQFVSNLTQDWKMPYKDHKLSFNISDKNRVLDTFK